MLIGNKCDLREKRLVSKEAGNQLAAKLNLNYLETSAKTRENVDSSFLEIFTIIKETKKFEPINPEPVNKVQKSIQNVNKNILKNNSTNQKTTHNLNIKQKKSFMQRLKKFIPNFKH